MLSFRNSVECRPLADEKTGILVVKLAIEHDKTMLLKTMEAKSVEIESPQSQLTSGKDTATTKVIPYRGYSWGMLDGFLDGIWCCVEEVNKHYPAHDIDFCNLGRGKRSASSVFIVVMMALVTLSFRATTLFICF